MPMRESFDWQTDEDGDWEISSNPNDISNTTHPWRRYLLVVIPFLLIVGTLIFWQARERIEEAKQSRQSDILASYGLIRESAISGDVEIIRSLLSGADFQWAVTQQELVQKGWIYDLDFLGLERVPGSLNIVEVTLSPELDSAEITIEESYVLVSGNEQHHPVVLQRTEVFRPGDRWFWAPPTDEFWGGVTGDQIRGNNLTFFFPRRDKEILQRLQHDLDAILNSLCSRAGMCEKLPAIQVSFSRDPSSLLDAREAYEESGRFSDYTHLPDGRYALTLPTPTLMGMPIDDSGYETLRQGYGNLIIGGLLDDLLAKDCCGDPSMRQAIIRAAMNRLGLLAWIPGTSIQFQDDLNPVQDIQLLCSSGVVNGSYLWRYDVNRGSWRLELQDRHIVSLKTLPNNLGSALLEMATQNGDRFSRIILRHDGMEITLLEQAIPEDDQDIDWFVRERESRLMVEFLFPEQGETTVYVFDLRRCNNSGCEMSVYRGQGRPTWSPDGSQLLVRENGTIWQHRGDLAVPIGQGIGPFWVDDEIFGYHNRVGGEGYIALHSINDESEQVVLTTNTLKEGITPNERPSELVIGHVTVDPFQPSHWIILGFSLAMNGAVDEAYLFDFDYLSGKTTLIEHGSMLHSYQLANSSSNLATSHYDETLNKWQIEVYSANPKRSKTITLPATGSIEAPPDYSWTSDGQWLLILREDALSIYQPFTDQILTHNTPTTGCSQVVWAND